MSSTPLNYYAQMKSNNHSNIIIDLAEQAGQTIVTQDDLINFLQTVTSDLIVENTSHNGSYGYTFDTPWAPIVECTFVI